MGCIVFNLITTQCTSDEILSIKIFIRIKDRFMRVTSQIFDADLIALETSKSRCHSLVSQLIGCVENVNSSHNRNFLYPAKIVSKFTILFYLCLTNVISC